MTPDQVDAWLWLSVLAMSLLWTLAVMLGIGRRARREARIDEYVAAYLRDRYERRR